MIVTKTLTMILVASLAGCYSEFEGSARTPRAASAASRPAVTPRRASPKEELAAEKKAAAEKKKKEKKQTYRQAWDLICAAERLSGVDRTKSRAARGTAVASWIVDHLKNRRARYWFIALGQVKRAYKAAHFAAEFKRAGIKTCPTKDLLFDEAPASQPGG